MIATVRLIKTVFAYYSFNCFYFYGKNIYISYNSIAKIFGGLMKNEMDPMFQSRLIMEHDLYLWSWLRPLFLILIINTLEHFLRSRHCFTYV